MTQPRRQVARYMSKADIAEYIGVAGVKSLTRAKLPPPDAIIGQHPGWLPSTVQRWAATRPGPGWHGARDDPRRKGRAKR